MFTHKTERVGHASEIAWDLRSKNVEGPVVAVGEMAPFMKSPAHYEVVTYL